MSEKTNIEWATSTGNPWLGCTKVSPGCKNCYAAELDENRFSRSMGKGTPAKPESHWGKGAPRVRTKAFWKDALKWNKAHGDWLEQPCDPKFRPAVDAHPRPRIFPSLCDWLDDEVPIEWLADFLKLIHDTPNLDWLLLTKRPENFASRLLGVYASFPGNMKIGYMAAQFANHWRIGASIPRNVWIGVSVEDQQRADERIPLLLKIPAKIRFLSIEPLLEQVNLGLSKINYDAMCHGPAATDPAIQWVIVGAESGGNRRDCGVEALCDAARQGVNAGCLVFTKQDCAFKPGQRGRIPDDIWNLKQIPC